MKIIKRILGIVFILLSVFLFVSCATNQDSSEGKTIVTDLSGRNVELTVPVKRIITIMPSDAEIVCDLGAESIIVGRGTFCDYPESINQIPDVGSGDSINIEAIIALKLDCVILSKMATTLNQIEKLETADIKAIVCQPENLDEIYEYISILGKITCKEKESHQIICNMKNKVSKLTEATLNNPNFQNKKTLFIVSPLDKGIWVAGNNTFLDNIASIINLENCAKTNDGWCEISYEQLIKLNPDYIVCTADTKETQNELISKFSQINAVKNNCIFYIDDQIIRPTPRLLDAASILFDKINGSHNGSSTTK